MTTSVATRPSTNTTPVPDAAAPGGPTGYRPMRLLTPDEVALEWTTTAVLRVTVTPAPTDPPATEHAGGWRVYEPVQAYAAQPLTDPERYISLRVGRPPVEIGVIPDVGDFPRAQQQVLREALARRQRILLVTRIKAMREEYGFLTWEVESSHGPRSFTMPRWNQSYVAEYGASDQGRLVYDVYWNRYLIPDLAALDRRSRKLFGRYIYW